MYEITDETTVQTIESDGRTFRALMRFSDFDIGSSAIKTVQTNGGSCADDVVSVGGIYSQGVTIELSELPEDKDISRKTFVLYLYLMDLNTETDETVDISTKTLIKIGTYKVSSCKRKGYGYTVKADDRNAEADIEYSSALSYPTTTNKIENEICTKMCITKPAPEKRYYITKDGKRYCTSDNQPYCLGRNSSFVAEKPKKITMRKMLGYIAMLNGKFVICDRDNNIDYKWYTGSGYMINANRMDDPEHAEKNISVTGIECKISDKESIFGGDRTGKIMTVENPYMTQEVLDSVVKDILPFTYRPVKVNHRLGDPRIDVWDMISCKDVDNNTFTFPVTELSYKFDGGGLSAEIESGNTDT